MVKKILIAEDDKFISNVYRVKLTKAGFEVKIAGDGQEALKILQTFIPDLILLDLVMPIKDGFETLEVIKADERLKTIPVIVASDLGQKEDREKALKLGADGFFIKGDLALDTLIQKIHSIVG